MTPRPTAVFRFDASPTIGGGHAIRSSALATALAGRGWRAICATREETIETTPMALKSFDKVVRLGGCSDGEIDEIASQVGGSCHAVVVDHYGRDRRFDRACRRIAPCVAVIEDRPAAIRDCDVLVNQSMEPDGMRSGSATDTRLIGPRYAILRPEFCEARSRGMQDEEDGCLLLLCGFSDEHNLTEHLFNALVGLPGVRTIHVILGSANIHRERVQRRVARTDAYACVHVDPSPLPELMSRAALAVTAAGTTCWELACLGIPMITVVAAPNQIPVSRTLHAAGASEDAGEVDDALRFRVRERVAVLLGDGAKRRRMAARGRHLVDGRGALRVARAIDDRAVSRKRSMQ